MGHRRSLFFAASLLVLSSSALAQTLGNSQAITPDRLRAHLEFVASDLMEGRDTPSRGLDITANYLAAQLALWGVKPAGDNGTYFQRIALIRPGVNAAGTSLSLGGPALGLTLEYGKDFTAVPAPGSASGSLVYVGYGYGEPGSAEDVYKKIDVRDKVVLVLDGRPAGMTFRDIRAGKYLAPAMAAKQHGAKGVILVSFDEDSVWNRAAERSTSMGRARPVMEGEANPEPLPMLRVRGSSLAPMLEGEAVSLDDLRKRASERQPGEPFALNASKTVTFKVDSSNNTTYTQNVVAKIEGSDPNLKNEYVALGAHYDHVGMNPNGTGDVIFNGADDDGSGTVSILEIAHAFAIGPKPKRSLLFVWHTGEEKGLWGSDYFVNKPTVPLQSVVAQLNIDMIGRSKAPGDTNPANKGLSEVGGVFLIGTTRMSTELGQLAKETNSKLHNLKYDFTYDDLNHPERLFFRSDHYNYAVKGIPILFWFDGIHEDYHKVSDHVEKIDFTNMTKIAQTVYATAMNLGNRAKRPAVDMPLPAQE